MTSKIPELQGRCPNCGMLQYGNMYFPQCPECGAATIPAHKEKPVEIPEGFVEFAMQMMKRAKELRAEYQPKAETATELMGQHLQDHLRDPVSLAALACLASVEPPTMELAANAN